MPNAHQPAGKKAKQPLDIEFLWVEGDFEFQGFHRSEIAVADRNCESRV